MSDPVAQIVEMVGCPKEEAERAYQEMQDIVAAVELLLRPPVCAGNQYLPPKIQTNRHLDPEQRERCEKGRKLAEQINGVRTSAAHSAIQSAQTAALESLSTPAQKKPTPAPRSES